MASRPLRLISALPLLLVLGFAAQSTLPALASPPAKKAAKKAALRGPATKALRGGQKRIDTALDGMNAEGSDKVKGEDALRLAVNGFIDFKELARRALGTHWDKRTPEEQKSFQDTMQALVEAAYLARVSERGEYKVAYLGEDPLEKGEVLVRTELRARKGAIPIDYRLFRREKKWLVYDVITDDLSLLESYRSQFNQLIKKKGFEGLLSTLERKRAEIEAKTAAGGATGQAPADG